MRQNLGSGLCLTQCRAIGRPRLSGRVGVRKAWVGVGMDGVRDREGVRYGVVEGVWLRAGLGVGRDWGTGGLWYGWVGCIGWGKRVGMRAGWAGIGEWMGWGTGGLGYGWVGVRNGVFGVGQESRDKGRAVRDWGGDTGGLGCVRVFWGNG